MSRRAEYTSRTKHKTGFGCSEFPFPIYSAKAQREILAAKTMPVSTATHAISRGASGADK